MSFAYQTQGFSDYKQTVDAGHVLSIEGEVAKMSAPIGKRSYISTQVRAKPGDTVRVKFTARLKSGDSNTCPGALLQASLSTGTVSSNVEVLSKCFSEYECSILVPKHNGSLATVTVTIGSWTSVGGEIEVVGVPRVYLEGEYVALLSFAVGMIECNHGVVSVSQNHSRFGIESVKYDIENKQVVIETSSPRYGNGWRAPFAIANQTLFEGYQVRPVADFDRSGGVIFVKFYNNAGEAVSILDEYLFFNVMLVG